MYTYIHTYMHQAHGGARASIISIIMIMMIAIMITKTRLKEYRDPPILHAIGNLDKPIFHFMELN